MVCSWYWVSLSAWAGSLRFLFAVQVQAGFGFRSTYARQSPRLCRLSPSGKAV
jgi:hypothetical protein